MKRIGIVCALPGELEVIKNNLNDIKEESFSSGTFYTGTVGNAFVIACVCGVGKVNSAIRTQIMIDKFSPDAIINSGSAGSLCDRAKHLSVIVGKDIYYHDFDLDLFQRVFPYCRFFSSNEEMSKAFLSANSEYDDITSGNIATGDTFVSGTDKKNYISSLHDGICVEMEGAAIAHTAYVNKLPCLIVRAISDMADENADGDYDEFERIVSEKVARYLLNYLRSI